MTLGYVVVMNAGVIGQRTNWFVPRGTQDIGWGGNVYVCVFECISKCITIKEVLEKMIVLSVLRDSIELYGRLIDWIIGHCCIWIGHTLYISKLFKEEYKNIYWMYICCYYLFKKIKFNSTKKWMLNINNQSETEKSIFLWEYHICISLCIYI